MGKGSKKNKKAVAKVDSITNKILSLERIAGEPVVISLLVEDGDIEFVSCVAKQHSLLKEDEGDEEPGVDLTKIREDVKGRNLLSCKSKVKNYIG